MRRCCCCGNIEPDPAPSCRNCGTPLSVLDTFAVWSELRRLVLWAGLGSSTAATIRFLASGLALAVLVFVALRLWLPVLLTERWEQEAITIARAEFSREHSEEIADGGLPDAARTRARVHTVEFNRGERATVIELDWRQASPQGGETIESRCYAITDLRGRLRALRVLCPDA